MIVDVGYKSACSVCEGLILLKMPNCGTAKVLAIHIGQCSTFISVWILQMYNYNVT